jgi:putative membrane protein
MFYYTDFFGMNLVWWFIFAVLLFWIFATPYKVPGQRRRRNTPLNILKQRFASGQITEEEYTWKRETIERDLAKLR